MEQKESGGGRGMRKHDLKYLNRISNLYGLELYDVLHSDHSKSFIDFDAISMPLFNENIRGIAEFGKIIKNYIKLKRITNGLS
jgi:hypothetical protein